MRMLLVEGNSKSASAIEFYLSREGFNVFTTDLGEEGVDLARLYDYPIIVCSDNLPDMDGLDVIRDIRSRGIGSLILALSEKSGIAPLTAAFAVGSDDFMRKWSDKENAGDFRLELACRVHALAKMKDRLVLAGC